MPQAGFVFLAMTKTGSTAVESALERHAQVVVRRPPRMKHATARTFDKVWVPVLEHYGYPRESYELVSVVRHPVDWVHSWYRYRSRPGASRSVGDLTFDEYAAQVVAGEARLGSASAFVRPRRGRPGVDRVYRYEHLGDAVAWMAGKLEVDVPELGRVNASPATDVGPGGSGGAVSPGTRALLEQHYARDVALWESAR